MAKEASLCLLFLSFLITSTSGALVGFSYREKGDTSTSASAGTISFLQQSKVSASQIRILVADHRILSTLNNSNLSVDFYLNKSQVEKFITSKPSAISWLKAHIVNLLPQVDIESIIVSCGSECLTQNDTPALVSALKSVHLVLSKLNLAREVKVSVAFPLSFLENLNASHEKDLSNILSFIKKTKSYVMVEDSIDAELSMGDHFVQSITKRAALAASILPCKDVPLVLTIKSQVIPSSRDLAQFSDRASKYLESRTDLSKRIVALYAEVHTEEDFAQKELKRQEEEGLFPAMPPRRVVPSKSHQRRTLDDTTNPPNRVSPTNPTSGTPVITTPDTPTIITVPSSTNPVTISPSNPATMPVTIPSTTPVPLPPTNPANSPVTNPATSPNTVPGTQPATNPAASFPPPSGSVPAANPQPPPATVNAPPAIQGGQSWCVAKNGAAESALQAALDYACGMGGADCSQIQQGGSCYSPVTLQNHASFAFNSYYQKHPALTSCDFGGTATLVSTNPSTGSCIFPSSSSSSSSSSSTTTTPPSSSSPTTPTPSISTPPPSNITPPSTPTTTTPITPSVPTAPPTPSSSNSGSGTSGYGTPPSVLNSSNPASSSSSSSTSGTMPTGFGFQTPPDVNTTSSSYSVTHQRPLVGYIVLITSFVTARLNFPCGSPSV